MSGIRKDLSSAHHHLQVKTREYMEEVKALTEKLAEIKTKHRFIFKLAFFCGFSFSGQNFDESAVA